MTRRLWRRLASCGAIALVCTKLAAQDTPSVAARSTVTQLPGDSVTVRIADTDVRTALMLLARFLDRPLVIAPSVTGGRVSLETPRPLPRGAIPGLLRSIATSQGLEIVDDSSAGVLRVITPAPVSAAPSVLPAAAGVPTYGSGSGGVQLWIIPIRYARAARVAAVVNALYGRASALGELGAPATTLSEQLRRQGDATLAARPPGPAPGGDTNRG
ncbi:MAG: hypothetical protein MUE41_09380, partial [Gemmatimonadaceae bacterium]|nr:hypothetical protein [Gemmatimonadaceae bacterium]